MTVPAKRPGQLSQIVAKDLQSLIMIVVRLRELLWHSYRENRSNILAQDEGFKGRMPDGGIFFPVKPRASARNTLYNHVLAMLVSRQGIRDRIISRIKLPDVHKRRGQARDEVLPIRFQKRRQLQIDRKLVGAGWTFHKQRLQAIDGVVSLDLLIVCKGGPQSSTELVPRGLFVSHETCRSIRPANQRSILRSPDRIQHAGLAVQLQGDDNADKSGQYA